MKEEYKEERKSSIYIISKLYLRKSVDIGIQFNLSIPKHFEFIVQFRLCHVFSAHYVNSTVIGFVMNSKYSKMTSYAITTKL